MVKVRYGDLKSIRQKRTIVLRGEIIAVERLSWLLRGAPNEVISELNPISILILGVNGKKFGLMVDSVFRQEEIVVKPLPESYVGVPGLASTSILGDGRVILILDVPQLHELMTTETGRADLQTSVS